MDLKKKISYKEWNVGFFNALPEDFISNSLKLSDAVWLKRESRYHCYADPFILDVTENEIDLLVEDILLGSKNVATICHLKIDKNTGDIISKHSLIDDDIHNSYPLIVRGDSPHEVYIIPENSYSNNLNIYKYDTISHNCKYYSSLLPLSVVDTTILSYRNSFYLFATSRNAYNSDLYIWFSKNKLFGYKTEPLFVKSNLKGSRMAGDFIYIGDSIYRPSQDCLHGYGKGIILYKVDDISTNSYHETEVLTLYPSIDSYYSDGLHTINFYKDICVIDGYKNHYNFIEKIYRKIFNKYRS